MKTSRLLLFVLFMLVLTFSLTSFTHTIKNSSNKFVVVLDAGHGGDDPGNLGNGYKEKDIALKVVLAVGKLIEKHPDIEVVYTRKKDVFVDLHKRGKIANNANADLFVSIHCNGAKSASAHGTETFVLGTHRNKTNFEVAKKENSVIFLEEDYEKNYAGFNPNSPESVMSILISQEEYLDQSIQLASLVQEKFTNTLKRKNRGVKQAGFVVLHQTVMPSVLIELGFLSYKAEGRFLNSTKGQQQFAQAIASAILEYKDALEDNVGNYVNKNNNVVANGATSTSDVYPQITFKVQIAASSKSLETKPYNFKGLSEISKIKSGNLYKYFYGSTSNYTQAKNLETQAKTKGYTSSFLVAFKEGKQIKLTEALKTPSN